MTVTPFKISRFKLASVGEIALCRMPGALSPIEADIADIVALGCVCVVTLTPTDEYHLHGAQRLPELLHVHGIAWHHFPIEDYGVPTVEQSDAWQALSTQLHHYLDNEQIVLIHCYAGVGRSGMIALRLFVERGAEPVQALADIRQLRPGAVERPAQYTWAINDFRSH